MSSVPAFADFYAAVNFGRAPFPWQRRLAALVADQGWPGSIGVPTGLGKTACLDIALWALASQAKREPRERTAPTRIIYVVNRRLLVDAANDHCERLARLLADPGVLPTVSPGTGSEQVEAIATVADALRSISAIGSESGPLHVARLRGDAQLGSRSPDPSQPTMIFTTVPMFASRWLFRGYGSSRSMRPIDAALMGIDSLVLLDEAHLAQPLRKLASQIRECDLGDPERVLVGPRSRPQLVELTATGSHQDRFDLDAQDYAHPVVARRLAAPKPTKLTETRERDLNGDLASEVIALHAGRAGSAAVVFVNSPRRARDVAALLADRAPDHECVLLTGRMRAREADRVRSELLDEETGVASGRSLALRDRPLTVVATQTLEVGADVDFDFLVTETAGARAITQRLGRLNRLGDRPHAAAVICHPLDRDTEKDRVYGSEPPALWASLTDAAGADGVVQLHPGAIAGAVGEPLDVPPRTGELFSAHLWEFAKTSTPPPGEAPPEVFFEGLDETNAPSISVCWRSHIPDVGARLVPLVRGAETVEVPVWEVRAALAGLGLETVARLDSDRATIEMVDVDTVRPGDQLVVPARAGGYDQNGWNPDARGAVLDVSPFLSSFLPLATDALTDLAGAAIDADLVASLTADDREDLDELAAIEALVADLQDRDGHEWMSAAEWHEFLASLDPDVQRPVDAIANLLCRRGPTAPGVAPVRADAFDELSFTAKSVGLYDHLGSVGETAERIASRLGLASEIALTVALAGHSHDLGKADARFQRWLDPAGSAGEPVAKSGARSSRWEANRIASGWPRGGRHELLSSRLVQHWLDAHDPAVTDRNLLLHLVISHHGHGRPLVPTATAASPAHCRTEFRGAELCVDADLARTDWDQPARFRSLCERYGFWGLALLEAVVRQADHAVSSVIEVV